MDNEMIRKYMSNTLSREERNSFEQEIENDPLLEASINGLEEWSADHPGSSLEKTANELNKRIDERTASSIESDTHLLHYLKYAVATSIILVCSVGVVGSSMITQPGSYSSIYSAYFKPMTDPDASGENNPTGEPKSFQPYEKEDYFSALKYYEKKVADDPRNIRNNLFLGISFLATNQPQKAIEVLSQLTASSEFYDDIQWYLALAYIKNKEPDKARSVLYPLTGKENYYKASATEILEKLDPK